MSRPTDPIQSRSPVLVRFFSAVMYRQMRRHFHSVRMDGEGLPHLPPGRAVVVYSNHPSWWDPALYIVLSGTCFPGREGFGPMDSEALRQYGFMRRIGVFGVQAHTYRGSAAFLRTARAILARPNSVLWITAEGAFTDPRTRPVRLQPGVAHVMARLERVVAVPLAIEYCYWTERLPEALCRFGTPLEADREESAKDWQRRLEESLSETMDTLAAKAIRRDPSQFHTLLQGRTGIGGVYDAWRRGRAMLHGRRFEPGHGDRQP